ncbi:WcaF family extracellular polysaccharide biosynthesis acetyltransferase [Draconibacterium sp. IB214405]|uniref:WcaF family extracellular polysaccharide biosynthesis acetyltransferase n=1 Tax=Draconibacterium sp. IB214405 TaxID=3097352 RepID=UPI002A1696D6|nr:WcaF family extracellular polysaccharide biosynthesis acetyltransferase [Draconibacterium sp. IB214405]MDX8339291.1 WcaF family extracellular polysaccharide biosynthesis acetyltransferase [Draconibacterium sp. IB214405]
MPTRLETFNPNTFDKGTGAVKKTLWFFLHALLIESSWMPIVSIKVFLLRRFGAKVGKGLVIKPSVRIKFPWKLEIGDHVWLGEGCWIDNLDHVKIGSNVCISQGAMLLTGNHDYSVSSFDYRNAPIELEDGVWMGAQSVVCPGVHCKSHSILTVGSVATKDLEPYSINQGNPAKAIRKRFIEV